jgi:hypothetical protein
MRPSIPDIGVFSEDAAKKRPLHHAAYSPVAALRSIVERFERGQVDQSAVPDKSRVLSLAKGDCCRPYTTNSMQSIWMHAD